jgi:hypothetical protein
MKKIMLKSDLISLTKKRISEDQKPKGLTDTEKVQKKSKAINKDYYKATGKKVDDFNKLGGSKEEKDFKAPKRELDDKEKEIASTTHGLGMEDLVYDSVVDDTYKDRQEKALKGDSTMGNKTYEGEYDPETGCGNGNTEEVWGASGGKNTGETIIQNAKNKSKVNQKPNFKGNLKVPFGEDEKVMSKTAFVESVNKNKSNKKTMKRLKFKKPIQDIVIAKSLIPENYKTDGNVFLMSDGNKTFKIRWEGNLTEGTAIELASENKSLMTEEMEKIKHLMGYKSNSKEVSGILKGKERINENDIFMETLEKKKL